MNDSLFTDPEGEEKKGLTYHPTHLIMLKIYVITIRVGVCP